MNFEMHWPQAIPPIFRRLPRPIMVLSFVASASKVKAHSFNVGFTS